VTMDLELPGMDGVEATTRIMSATPVPVLVLSAHTERGSDRAAAALSAGALEALPKSGLELTAPDSVSTVALRRRIKRLARTRLRRAATRRRRTHPGVAHLGGRTASVVGVCSSTGGPAVLEAALRQLPADFPVPVLVVQHMSAGFTEGLVRWIGGTVALPARLATDRARLAPGVTFAPDGAHLMLLGNRLLLDGHSSNGLHRPSGDMLLHSLAATRGPDAAGVVLTGLGRDGADGLAAVAEEGGITIAQDEESSVVYGMPRAAAERGAELVLSPAEIGHTLLALGKKAR
jgi:two-component system, chemotaxis family, protein-glutamate methylesterase/glutaminase